MLSLVRRQAQYRSYSSEQTWLNGYKASELNGKIAIKNKKLQEQPTNIPTLLPRLRNAVGKPTPLSLLSPDMIYVNIYRFGFERKKQTSPPQQVHSFSKRHKVHLPATPFIFFFQLLLSIVHFAEHK